MCGKRTTFRLLFINELLQHLVRYRFSILMLLVFGLFVTTALTFQPEIRKQRTTDVEGNEPSSEPLFVLAQRTFEHRLKPNAFSFCVSGRLGYLPSRFAFGSMLFREIRLKREAPGDVFVPRFPELDWVFIIRTLMAFMAIALTFDAICGDKERGVLRLILSYPVPRVHLFLAKYTASLIVLLVPLFFAMISALFLIQRKGVVLGRTEYIVLGIIAGLSSLFLSVYVLLGILFSSLTTRSEVSLLLLTISFTVFSVLIPGGSAILARRWHPIPSQLEIRKKIEAVYEDAGNSIRLTQVDLRVRQTISELWNAHREQQLQQADLAVHLAFLSPNFIFEDACMDMAGYGLWRITRTIRQLKQHIHVLDRFILERDREDPESPHAGIIHYRTLSRKPVNLQDMPRFSEREPSLVERLLHAAPNVVALILLNTILASLTLLSMNKYDAR